MRYVNPHMGQPVMMQQPMQQMPQMQQPVTLVMTPQGPAMMTPQGMVVVQVQQTPQGPMMATPQGMVPVQFQQQQMPQMQMPQQQQFPQGGMMVQHGGGMPQMMPGQQFQPQQFTGQQFPSTSNQSVVSSRFGQPSTTMETPSLQSNDNRFQTYQSPAQQLQAQQQAQQQVVQPVVDGPVRPALFTVAPVIHKFAGNEKFKMNVITDAVKPNQLNYEEGYLACDCLEENVETVIEQAYKGEVTPLVTVRNYIINNNFWRVDLKEVVNQMLGEKDKPSTVKELYKVFKATYVKLTDKHQINVLNMLNTTLTDVINDYLAVNSLNMIEIESFYTDYNDLLKIIRTTEEDLEETLVEYLNDYVDNMKIALTNTQKTDNATQITEMVSLAYVDKHVLETGLDAVAHQFVQLDDALPNAFLKSLAAEVIAKINKPEFLLVTLDKSIYKFMVNPSATVFVKKIA